jgi:pteridine reductase
MPLQTAHTRALVAGGTGRVGRAIAASLEEDGWRVVAAGRPAGDLATRAGARALVSSAVDELGGLELVVHAAGDGFVPKPVAEVTEADWDAAFGATAKGTFFLAQAAAPHLEGGLFVVVEDVAAYQPWPSFAAHCAAKAAQAMLTRVLARALAPGVRVCGVVPGAVAVAEGQEERRARESVLGRIGSPADVGDAVRFLASSPHVSGTSLVVDGGRLLQSGARPGP